MAANPTPSLRALRSLRSAVAAGMRVMVRSMRYYARYQEALDDHTTIARSGCGGSDLSGASVGAVRRLASARAARSGHAGELASDHRGATRHGGGRPSAR